MKNRAFHRRFGFALQGIVSGLRHEASLRQQSAAAVCVLTVLIWRRPAAI